MANHSSLIELEKYNLSISEDRFSGGLEFRALALIFFETF